MKLKDGFILTEIGDEHILVPASETAHYGHVVRMNDTAAFIVEQLRKDVSREQIVDALLDQYEVEKSEAEQNVNEIIEKMRSINALEE